MKILTAAAMSTLLLGASAQAQSPDPKAGAAKLAAETLAEPLKIYLYDWQAGQAPTLLPAVATHFCILTGFTGKLAGAGELAQLYVDQAAQGGARFMLGGRSGQTQFKVTATCAAKSQFVNGSMLGGLNEKIYPVVAASGCGAHLLPNAANGNAAAMFVAAFGGRFGGDGENVSATRAGNSGATQIDACSGSVSGATLSIGPIFGKAVYRTPTGTSTDPNASTAIASYKNDWKDTSWWLLSHLTSSVKTSSTGTVYPALLNDALCGIVGIRGKFNGYGEHVTVIPAIENGQKWWSASVQASSSANLPAVSVAVRCYARDQRTK